MLLLKVRPAEVYLFFSNELDGGLSLVLSDETFMAWQLWIVSS